MGVEHEPLQQVRREQIQSLLQQDAQAAEQQQSLFDNVEQMKVNKAMIDQALMNAGNLQLTDREQYRLRAIQGRTISHLLLSQRQFATDSPEMEDVKNNVAGLEMKLNREWDADNAIQTLQELESDYNVAIMFCQKYCDCKRPTFRSGKERKQMVQETMSQLQSEMNQLRALKRMIGQGQLPENVNRQRDLLVAGEEYLTQGEQQAHRTQQPAGMGDLTYADFAAMLGTHNRGQIEFSENGLRMINNHALSVSEGSVSAENYQLREQLFALAKEKMGEQLTADFSYQIQEILGLNAEKKESKPLSRKDLYEVITVVNMRSSKLSRTLKAGEQAPESSRRFAEKVNGLIGAKLGEWDVTYTPEQVEKQMKQELEDLYKTAAKKGVQMPKLSKHQRDVLVKGNLPLLRDGLFSAMNSIYDMASRINGGEDADIDMVADRDELIYQLMSHEISKITAQTPQLRMIAEQEQKAYMTKAVFEMSNKMQLGQDFERSFVGELAVKGSEGLEQEVKKRLPQVKDWQLFSLRMQRGTDSLGALCDQLQKLSVLQQKALEAGLSDAENHQMQELAGGIQQMIRGEKPVLDDMEFVAEKLEGTRFKEGLELVKSLINEQGFSFVEAAEHIAQQVRPLKQIRSIPDMDERADMDQMLDNVRSHMEKMSEPAKQLLQILTLDKKASDLVEKRNDETSGEIIQLRRALLRLQAASGKEMVEQVKLADSSVQLVKDRMDVLSLVDGRHAMVLPFGLPMLIERLEADMLGNESLYEPSEIASIVQGLYESRSDEANGGDLVRERNLCLKLLQSRTGRTAAFFNNISIRRLKEYAEYLVKGIVTVEAVIEDVNRLENTAMINGEEALALLKKTEELRVEEMQQKVVSERENQVATNHPETEWKEKELQVKDMLADLIFSTQTWQLDENEHATMERLQELEERHAQIREQWKAASDPATKNKLLEAGNALDKELVQLRTTQSAERMQGVIINHLDALYEIVLDPKLLEDMLDKLPLPENQEEGQEQAGIKDAVRDVVHQMLEMKELNQLRDAVNGPYKPFNDWIRNGFKAVVTTRLRQKDAMDQLAKMDKKVSEMVEEGMDGIQQMITTAAKGIFKSKDPEDGQKKQGDKKLSRDQFKDKQEWQEASRKELNRMIKEAANGDRGQGLFTKHIFQNYFKGVSLMDQRAMLASALRNAKPSQEPAADLSPEEQEAHKKKVMGNYLGGILKGAGPLLQKTLQGMPLDTMPEELKGALKDMRSNLAPIPPAIVQAQLYSMVERSHGKVEKIEIVKALGAASVGQAFLCRFKGPDLPPEGKEMVVKLLRPNVRNHMMREKNVMIDCAKRTDNTYGTNTSRMGGMEATYCGQLMRIEEELDLTIEARNVERGRLYDEGLETVQSMKLSQLVEPTVNAMVVEKAPGTTLDKYMEEMRKSIQEKLEVFYMKDENGNVEHDEAGRPLMTCDGRIDMGKTYAELNELNEQMRSRQKYLLTLADKWVTEGVFGRGFYHGDLHAGNIMVSDDKMTIIDFGNATQLNHEQQCHVVKMMLAASCGMVEDFQHGFHMLLENTPEDVYKDKSADLENMLKEVFDMGTQKDTGSRIAVALLKAQELGLELPPAIANFSQSQIRLQQTIEELNNMIEHVSDEMLRLRNSQMVIRDITYDMFKLRIEQCMGDRLEECRHMQTYFAMDVSRDAFFENVYKQQSDEERASFVENSASTLRNYANYSEGFDKLLELTTPKKMAELKKRGTKKNPIAGEIITSGYSVAKELQRIARKYGKTAGGIDVEQLRKAVLDWTKKPLDVEFQTQIKQIGESLQQLKAYEVEQTENFLTDYRQQLEELWRLKGEPNPSREEVEQKEAAVYDTYMKRQIKELLSDPEINGTIESLEVAVKDGDPLFDDAAYMGAQLREARRRFMDALEQNAPDLEDARYQMQNLYVQIQCHKFMGLLDALEHSYTNRELLKRQDTFYDVMADVISDNKKAAANRLGIFYAMKVALKRNQADKE